ncbi:LuxR C-terminal-related transcriptional regulator [Streptomyces sp. NPDC058572]|uniref:LuxR C-terminal-related transcriptional regulator n=1 Tax=Streptomyces sp. NPDC058572 TaxID=3346546 RepID=UPI00365411BC
MVAQDVPSGVRTGVGPSGATGAAPPLRTHVPGVKVVIFTAYPEHAALEEALGAGAHAVVVKDAERSDLVDIVRRVNAGERVVRTAEVPGLTRNTVKTYLQRTLEKLGARNRVEALARAGERGILQASRTRRGSVRVPWRGRGSSPASTAARSSRGDRTGRRRPLRRRLYSRYDLDLAQAARIRPERIWRTLRPGQVF